MIETDHSDIQNSLVDQTLDVHLVITTLRQVGANQFDPIRFHFIEVLANRVNAHQGSVRRILEGKLAQALVVFRERFEQAQQDAKDAIDDIALHSPQAVADLQRLLESGDFRGVKQCVATLKKSDHPASLGELARYIAQHSPGNVDQGFDVNIGLRSELKATQYFRNTWSRLSVEKRVIQALDQAPKNAGPINSHRLVLHSLAMMRDISPDYLNRFTSYVDALLCLDQRDVKSKSMQKRPLVVKTVKK